MVIAAGVAGGLTAGELAAGAAVASAAVSAGSAAASSSAQSSANSKAAGIAGNMFNETKNYLNSARDQARADVMPWQSTGMSANSELAWQLGLPQPGYADYQGQGAKGALMQNYTPQDYQNDPGYTPMVNSLEELQATPGYQFQLQQGLQSVNNSAAAQGSLLSGKQIQAVNNYAQNTAATGYQSAWDRAQQAYNNAFNRDTTNKNNTFQRLQSVSNNGQSAATQAGNDSMQAGSALAGASTNYGNTMGNLALAQGQTTGQLYSNLGSAVNSGIAGYVGNQNNGNQNNGNQQGQGGATNLPQRVGY